jgi:hypothetical protein
MRAVRGRHKCSVHHRFLDQAHADAGGVAARRTQHVAYLAPATKPMESSDPAKYYSCRSGNTEGAAGFNPLKKGEKVGHLGPGPILSRNNPQLQLYYKAHVYMPPLKFAWEKTRGCRQKARAPASECRTSQRPKPQTALPAISARSGQPARELSSACHRQSQRNSSAPTASRQLG